MGTAHDDTGTEPLSPQESLAIIEGTLADARRAFGFADWHSYAIWGAIWLVGFGATALGLGAVTVGLVWSAGVVVAGIVTAVVQRRYARGVEGTTTRVGGRLGVAWLASIAAAAVVANLLGLRHHQVSALFVLVVAVLYLAMGAAFLDDLQYRLGLWLLAVSALALVAGPPRYAAVMALLGGGGLLATAALTWRRECAPAPRARHG